MSLNIQTDLTLELVSGGSTPSNLRVVTKPDGALHVVSIGSRPRVTVLQTRVLLNRAREFVRATGQSFCITREARQILLITRLPGGDTKTNIHWWSLIRAVLTTSARNKAD